ncbi:hypothetical protein [Spirobacillus cienkowskii]|uniref:hypothetical protein n=1 Tax=Spirobacillus cienkowskii TaxID=495820 RepID=UPI0030D5B046
MDKIQGATATPDRKFTLGVPEVGTHGTIVTAEWLNHVQDEICNVILSENMSLDDSASNQLSAAIKQKLNALKEGCEQDIVGFKTEVEQWKKQIQSTILTLAKESELKRLQAITDTDKNNLLQCFEILNNFNNEFVEKVLQFLKTLEQNYFIQDSRFTEVFNAYGTYVLKHVGAKLNESTFQKFLDTNYNSFINTTFKNHTHPQYEIKQAYYSGFIPQFQNKANTSLVPCNNLMHSNSKNITKITNLLHIPTFYLKHSGLYQIHFQLNQTAEQNSLGTLKFAFGEVTEGLFETKKLQTYPNTNGFYNLFFEANYFCPGNETVGFQIFAANSFTEFNVYAQISFIKLADF